MGGTRICSSSPPHFRGPPSSAARAPLGRLSAMIFRNSFGANVQGTCGSGLELDKEIAHGIGQCQACSPPLGAARHPNFESHGQCCFGYPEH